MQDQELERLMIDLESDRAERKSSLSDKTDLCGSICAFANDLPGNRQAGVCFIGIDDRGRCTNLPITDQLLAVLQKTFARGGVLLIPAFAVGREDDGRSRQHMTVDG